MKLRVLAAVGLALGLVDTSVAAEPAVQKEWYEGKLAIGTRATWFSLLDDKHTLDDAFLGNLDQLDDDQDYAPYKLFAQYWFCEWGGLEVSWDKIAAEVINEPEKGAVADGSVEMSGPIVSVLGRYENETVYTPYLGLGVAIWSASFDHAPWHEYGYASPEAYAAAPEPKNKPQGGKTRDITVDDAIGLTITTGCDIFLTEHWSLDLYARYLDVAADAHYQLFLGDTPKNRDEGSFPLEHVALGLGAKYTF